MEVKTDKEKRVDKVVEETMFNGKKYVTHLCPVCGNEVFRLAKRCKYCKTGLN